MDSALHHLEDLFFEGNEDGNSSVNSQVVGISAKNLPQPPTDKNSRLTQAFSSQWDAETFQMSYNASSLSQTSPTHVISTSSALGHTPCSDAKSNNLSSIKPKEGVIPLVETLANSQLVRKERVSCPLFKMPSSHHGFESNFISQEKQSSTSAGTHPMSMQTNNKPGLPVSLQKPDLLQMCSSQDDMLISQKQQDPFSFMPSSFTLHSMTPGGSKQGSVKLKSVEEVPEPYRRVFNFPYFNIVQSKVFDDVFYSDKPVILCAPTGSGKTIIFELAIVRLQLIQQVTFNRQAKVVYMAPIKSLCSERFEDWKQKFGPLGLKCLELTGDSEIDYLFNLEDVHIILTTPEKWDSMTRRWKNNKSMVQSIDLFLIDEVHTINDESRGATMEAVISRMKTVHTELSRKGSGTCGIMKSIRFVACSATVPNVQDLGEWLSSENEEAATYNMDESHRPVRLRKIVLGYPCSESQSQFRFDLSLNYKLATIIQTYSDQRPTLVFCSTRKGTIQAANVLVKDTRFIMNAEHSQRLKKIANVIKDAKLRELIMSGVAFHHAGLDTEDRKSVAALFIQGDVPVLC